MRSFRLFAVAVLAVLMIAFMFQPAAAVSGTLDQQQTIKSVYSSLYSSPPQSHSQFVGETFTAGLTGFLTEVDLAIACYSQAGASCASYGPVTVEIHSIDPTGVLLASTSLPASAIPMVGSFPLIDFVAFVFASPPAVVAGSVYAIVMTTTNAPLGSPGYEFAWSQSYSYAAGNFWFTDATGWKQAIPTDMGDLAFKTFVTPPAAVGGFMEPVNKLAIFAPWLGVIGLVGCIGTAVVVAKKRRS